MDSLNVVQNINKLLFRLPHMWFQTTELLLDKTLSRVKEIAEAVVKRLSSIK